MDGNKSKTDIYLYVIQIQATKKSNYLIILNTLFFVPFLLTLISIQSLFF